MRSCLDYLVPINSISALSQALTSPLFQPLIDFGVGNLQRTRGFKANIRGRFAIQEPLLKSPDFLIFIFFPSLKSQLLVPCHGQLCPGSDHPQVVWEHPGMLGCVC